MKRFLTKIAILSVGLFLGGLLFVTNTNTAHAATNERMMDDPVFDNSGSMSAGDIQNFLNQFPNSCLKNFSDEYPVDYFTYNGPANTSSGPASAATIIRRAADLWGINPRVMLAKLEQEENLVTGNSGCNLYQYVSAVGFNCPGSVRDAVFRGVPLKTCVQSDGAMGFARQVTKGAWTLKFAKERSLDNLSWMVPDDANTYYYGPFVNAGNHKRCGSCSPIYHDGYFNGVDVQTGATASFYNYTPFLNQSFDEIYEGWFGSTYADAYNYQGAGASSSVVWMVPGQITSSNYILLRNTGYKTWYADGSVPPGEHPTRLMIDGYRDTPFADTTDPAWLGTRNQIKMTPSVVKPGEVASFNFRWSGPYQYLSNYPQHFIPIVDGVGGMRDSNMQFITWSVPPSYSGVSATNPPSLLLSNQTATATVVLKNTSGAPWYADGAVPAGKRPFRLASPGYQNTPFADTTDPAWLGTRNQIKMTPNVVNTGENATFTFKFVGPFSYNDTTFKFAPILDGVGSLKDIGMQFHLVSPQPIYNYQGVSATNPPATMSPGQEVNVQLVLKNTSNFIWRNESNIVGGFGSTRLVMINPTYRSSAFYDAADSAWLAPSQIAMTTPIVNPGENATFTFKWKAPAAPGNYYERFMPIIDGVSGLPDYGMAFSVKVQ